MAVAATGPLRAQRRPLNQRMAAALVALVALLLGAFDLVVAPCLRFACLRFAAADRRRRPLGRIGGTDSDPGQVSALQRVAIKW